jgi:hypothetical protein
VRLGTFNNDFGELAALVEREWRAQYGERTHFRYSADWIAAFFGGPEACRELQIECRDEHGELTAFVGAAPRRCRVAGRDVRFELVTLLTSARKNHGLIAFELLRESFRRAAATPGVHGTYHCALAGERMPNMLRLAAGSERLPHIEIASAPSLMGMAKPAVEADADVRPAIAGDAEALVEFVATAQRGLPVARAMSVAEFREAAEPASSKRVLVLHRNGRLTGVCVYARRQLLGAHVTEVANIDLLVAPDTTSSEATRFGKAIGSDAAARGATFLLSSQRDRAIFPHVREAGLRVAPRSLRVFVVPTDPGLTVEPGSAHLLEIE